ncbi:MAG TPA: hypothetical protein VIL27_10175, partial [Clostridia bacterium]
MPSSESNAPVSPLAGKSKADLATIAEMTGLIKTGEAKGMTIARLTALIENRTAPEAEQPVSAVTPARRGRKPKGPVVPAVSEVLTPPVPEVPSETIAPRRRGR